MKKIKLWKRVNARTKEYWWGLEEVQNDWDNIHSDPYWVEIPDKYHIGESICGEPFIYPDDRDTPVGLVSSSRLENCYPILYGQEIIHLRVLGPAPRDDD